ncbi:intracellular membrane involved in nucleoside transport [Paramyrothecium foliicola]|nr:intracellular membrane involved in nucleoside transport [Paramyrothecium foliicola]
MDRVRRAFSQPAPGESEYEPLTGSDEPTALEDSAALDVQDEVPFSWTEYGIFTLLGVAMLWAWNMFLAAAPYFSSRFAGDDWIQANFQSAILTVSTVTNLGSLLVLSNLQYSASYPFRINLALCVNVVLFALLTVSTSAFLDASPRLYLAFLLLIVACSSWATGLIQNGAFAFAGSFRRSEYMQALMVGQAISGVVPAVAQVASVMLFPPNAAEASPEEDGQEPAKSQTAAFIYFLAAVIVSALTLVGFIPLVRRHNHIVESRMVEQMAESMTSIEEAERAARKVTSLWHLLKKLRWLAASVAVIFATTMFFPVLTAKIVSVRPDAGGLFRPEAFIPLGFFFWNLGDFGGRMATALPFSLAHRPQVLLALSVARIALLPLYFLCNIGGRGAIISSDFFYLFVVQGLFGLTNGWLGSSCMIASGQWVDEGEREAAGGFMGLCLVVGLASGSLLSFTVSGV